jgi:hypothetical protein
MFINVKINSKMVVYLNRYFVKCFNNVLIFYNYYCLYFLSQVTNLIKKFI